jgi:hypothetical protein
MKVLLNENDEQIMQPNTIKIELMNHQKTVIKRMLDIEEHDDYTIKHRIGYTVDSLADGKIETNVGILADKVGAGKTLSTISLLSIRPLIKEKLSFHSGTKYIGLKVKSIKKSLDCALIIVPHKLVPQWKKAFEQATNLNVYSCSTNGQIDGIVTVRKTFQKNWKDENVEFTSQTIDEEIIKKYNVIIVGDTMYKRFYSCTEQYKWNRIFIDEADSIKLPRNMECDFNFLWLITGTPSGLFSKSKPFIGKIFSSEVSGELMEHVTFKNDDKYIDQSILLPHPKRIIIKCLTPRELTIIKDLIPSSVLQMINAGNSEEAIKSLNCNVDTNENILQVITKNLQDSIGNKKIELDAEKKKHYPVAQKAEHDKKIKFIENALKKLEEKYQDIKKKIYDLNEDFCPVCMSEFINPVIVSCCKNCFCFDCLAVSMGELKNNICPFCRQGITKSDIHVISNNTQLKKTHNISDLKDKLDVLVDLIQKKKDGSFMVFANYSETFSKIEKKLVEIGVSYCILKGQASTVQKHINDFENKKIKVLMLNAQFFGAGMNLHMTTDLVIYHRFTREMEEQIIGRAQRLGRTCPLNVYYLIHDNESSNIEDKFGFKDVNNIHYLDWIDEQNNLNLKPDAEPDVKPDVKPEVENELDLTLGEIATKRKKTNKNIVIVESDDVKQEVKQQAKQEVKKIKKNISKENDNSLDLGEFVKIK